MATPPSPVDHMSLDQPSSQPPLPAYSSSFHRDFNAQPQPQHQEQRDSVSDFELDSMSHVRLSSPPNDGLHALYQSQVFLPHEQDKLQSEFILDSPPHITILTVIGDEPGSPTSPPLGSPEAMDTLSPTFGTDTDTNECDFSDEEDPYFKSLVDNFATAVDDVCKSTLPEDDIDDKVYHEKVSAYAKSALMHYNNNEKHKVKYELISVVSSCGIMGDMGCCAHVNFIAKGDQQNSEEELFFAELREDGYMTYATTCVVSLERTQSVGGLRGTRYDTFDFSVKDLRIDAQHCYACSPRIKHPKDGSLYKSGHVACSDYYFG